MRMIAKGFAALAALGMAASAPAQDGAGTAAEYRAAHEADILRDFIDLLSIPNHAFDADNIRRNAEHIGALYEARGFDIELLTSGDSPPLVYGRRDTPGAERTIAIYVHYDGQPVVAEQWAHPPFEPVLLDGPPETGSPLPADALDGAIDPDWRIQARSAGDDKAPVIALATALDALDQAGIGLTSNIILVFDGEEEVGSLHLEDLLTENAALFEDVDLWLFCDGPVHSSGRPQLVFGVRGFTSMEITVLGARGDLHSGHYGNWAPVPTTMLANLLASMKAMDGSILVEGWTDTARTVTDAERAAIAAIPNDEEALRTRFGLASTESDNAPQAERALFSSLTVRGLEAGGVGREVRNAIPATATANIEVRLAAGDQPEAMLDLLERHIAAQGFHIVREEPDDDVRLAHDRIVIVRRAPGYPGVRSAMDSAAAADLVEALSSVREDLVLLPSYGGTLPLYLFEEAAEAPIVILPIANQDNNQHAANENLRIGNLWYGIEAMAAVLTMD